MDETIIYEVYENYCYERRRISIAVAKKSTPITIVKVKMVLSRPRRA